jgi:hypothetical protein
MKSSPITVTRISGGQYERTTHPKWKYRLVEDLVLQVSIYRATTMEFRTEAGYLIARWEGYEFTIFKGYACDGASFWIDHEEGMIGWFWHDAGYQIAQILTRKQWDFGMLSLHAESKYKLRHIVYAGVRSGGWASYGKRDYVHVHLVETFNQQQP